MTTPTNSKSNSKANGVVRGAYATQLPLSTVTKPSEKESKKARDPYSNIIFTSKPVPSEKESRYPYKSSGSGNVTFTPKPDNSSSNR